MTARPAPVRRRRPLALLTAAALAAGTASAVAAPAAGAEEAAHVLESDQLRLAFADDGTIRSLTLTDDLFPTEYVMNERSAPEQAAEERARYKQWLGNLMFSYAEGDVSDRGADAEWRTAWTTQSADGRTVTSDADSVTVVHEDSADAEGIRDFRVEQDFSLADDGSLTWTQTATNTSDSEITIGDWGVPVPTNELWRNGGEIYEERVVTRSYVGGAGSYVEVTRPSGLGPHLLLSADAATGTGLEYQDRWRSEEVGDTPWAWNAGRETSNIRGLNTYYVHSQQIQKTNRGYLESTGLVLAPGESRTYRFHVEAVDDEDDAKDALFERGLLDATVVPGMIVPFDQKATLALRVKGRIEEVVGRNRGDTGLPATDPVATRVRTNGDHEIWEVAFDRTQLGANDLVVSHVDEQGRTRTTVLQMYVIDRIEDLLDTRADFMVDKTQWTAEDGIEPTNVRYGTFDDWLMNARDGSAPSATNPPQGRRDAYFGYWGLGDDWGLPHGQFLAEKNVALPDAEQVEALDLYLEQAVWQNLMGNTDDTAAPSYVVYNFWEEGRLGHANTTPSYRGYAYPHVYNTFFSMYQIARQNPDLVEYSRTPEWYLRTAYGIFKELYDGPVAYNWHTGLMGELTTPDLVAALRAEGMHQEAADVEAKMAVKYRNFSANKYPYGSEYSYDNTGEEAVYTLARLNVGQDQDNALRMMRDIVSKTRAARNHAPVWFHYANPITITGENWWNFQYTMPLAGSAMDDYIHHTSALETGENAVSSVERAVLARMNYAAKTGVLSSVNSGQISGHPDNVGAAAWTYQAERGNLGTLGVGGGTGVELLNGWRGMTGEADLGLWGALKTLSADVVTDDPVFGTVAYGADVRVTDDAVDVTPRDGLQRRLNLTTQQLSVDLLDDQYTRAVVQRDSRGLALTMRNVTGAAHDGALTVSGLAQGSYAVRVDGRDQKVVNVYSTPAQQGTLRPPTRVDFSAPAGGSYEVELVPTTAPANTVPVVDAGADLGGLTVGLDEVRLDGTVTDDGLGDPNGTLETRWSVEEAPEGAQVRLVTPDRTSTLLETDEAGTYVLRLTATDGELEASDTVTVTVEGLQPLPERWVDLSFDAADVRDGAVRDRTGNGNDGRLQGSATVTEEDGRSVLRLDGSSGSHLSLPEDIVSRAGDVTISTTVKLDSVGLFGRIWDFGSDTQRYMFLTSALPGDNLGFAISTRGNGAESQILTSHRMQPGVWTDISVRLTPNADGETTTGVITVDGTEVGRNDALLVAPADLRRTAGNYLGKSQFPDPYLGAAYDSFRIDGAPDQGPTEPEPPATDVALVDSLRTATGTPDTDATDHDIVLGVVEGVLERRPRSPLGVLRDPAAPVTAFLPDDAAMRQLYREIIRPSARQPDEAVVARRLVRMGGAARMEQVLLAHVVAERITSAQLAGRGGTRLTTLAGGELAVTVEGGAVRLDAPGRRAVVTATTDVGAGQTQLGHGVDGLLAP